jgi:hypothetical protein
MLSTTLAAALLVALAGSPGAHPSPDEERLFSDGLRAFDAGDARAAEKAWKAGYALRHDPAFLVRIGEAEERAGAPAEAAESYRRYLREAPDAADRAEIEERLTRLAPPAPGASATAPPGTGAGAAEIPGELGGAHAVPPSPLLPPGPPAARRPAATDAQTPGQPGDEEEAGWTPYNITAWIATAGAAALLGTAAFLAASAASKRSDVDRLITYRDQTTGAPLEYGDVARSYESAVSDGKAFDTAAKVTLVAAAASAAVAATFFVLEARRRSEPAVAVAPAARGAGLMGALTWSF